MEEFFGSAPPSQILLLMSVPCLGALLLTAFIIFSVNRRNKKSQMKLGILPKEEPPANNKPARPSPAARPASPAPQKPPASSSSSINLEILSQKVEETVTPMNSEQAGKLNLDLAARLAGFSPAPLPTSAALPDSAELLRLLRDQHGRLIVEVDGRQYTKLTDVADKKVGQYILDLTAHLLAFTNGVVATQTGIKSLAVPKTGDLPMPMVSRPADMPAPSLAAAQSPPLPPEDAESKLLASLKDSRLESETLRQKSGLFGIGKPAPASTNLPALNLADEINDIVQARLRSSPLEKDNMIVISSDPGGGIRIKVNNRYYASPDEIADPTVRDLIKSSIKEWERR